MPFDKARQLKGSTTVNLTPLTLSLIPDQTGKYYLVMPGQLTLIFNICESFMMSTIHCLYSLNGYIMFWFVRNWDCWLGTTKKSFNGSFPPESGVWDKTAKPWASCGLDMCNASMSIFTIGLSVACVASVATISDLLAAVQHFKLQTPMAGTNYLLPLPPTFL